jgi:hypothetical protein
VDVEINSIFKHPSPSTGDDSFRARMTLESITFYLVMKHLGVIEIHAEINRVLGGRAVGYSSMTRYL